MNMLQLSNSQKFSANTWHLHLKKINLVQAQMIETLSVSFAFHVHVEHAHESVLR